jgi:hypothetical protein
MNDLQNWFYEPKSAEQLAMMDVDELVTKYNFALGTAMGQESRIRQLQDEVKVARLKEKETIAMWIEYRGYYDLADALRGDHTI